MKYFLSITLVLLMGATILFAQDTTELIKSFNGDGAAAERAKASRKIAGYYDSLGLKDNAIAWAIKGLEPASRTSNDSLLYRQYDLISTLQQEAGDVQASIDTYHAFIKEIQSHGNTKQLAIAYNNLGVAYSKIGEYEAVTTNFIKAQKIYESIGLLEDAAETEANLASVYVGQGNYQKTIDILRPLIPRFIRTGNHRMLASAYGNTTSCFVKLKQYDSAIHYSKLQLPEAMATGSADKAFSAWSTYAYVCSKTGRKEEYKMANDSMLQYAKMSGNKQKEALTYDHLGIYYATVAGDMTKAKAYFEKGLALSREIGDKAAIVSALNNLAATYNELRDYKTAYKFMEEAYQFKDSVITDAGQTKVNEMMTRFQTEKKEAQIKLLDQQNQLQKRTSYFLIGGIALLALLGFVLIRNNRIKQQNNQKLDRLNKDLDTANQAKARLFSIIGHDLRSPINQVHQFLKLQQQSPHLISEAQKETISSQIQAATGTLLETMEDLLVWSKTQLAGFTPSIQPVDVQPLVSQTISLLQLHLQSKNLTASQHVPDGTVIKTDPDFLQIILRNLMQNAVKASPNGERISIAFDIKNGKPVIRIKNNGVLFTQEQYLAAVSATEDRKNLNGLGLRLVDELASKLGIAITFTNEGNDTTVVDLML